MIERHANAGIRRIEIKIFDDGSEEYKYFEEDIYINPSYLSNKIKETGPVFLLTATVPTSCMIPIFAKMDPI